MVKLNACGNFSVGLLSSGLMLGFLQPLNTVKNHRMAKKSFPSIRVLYRGTTSAAVSVLPPQALTFLLYGMFNSTKKQTCSKKIINGTAAGILVSPASCLLQRITILSQFTNKSPWKILPTLCLRGKRGVFKGYSMNALLDISMPVFLFGVSDWIKEKMEKAIPESTPLKKKVTSYGSHFLSGAISGALTTPIDVVRCRMHSTTEKRYLTTLSTIKELTLKEGKKVFFRGLGLRSGLIGFSLLILGISKEIFSEKLSCYSTFKSKVI